MAFARDSYTAGAAQTDYTITFPYISETHVTVYEDGVLQTEGASNDYTIVSGVTVRFNAGHAGGEVILLIRSSSRSARLVDYANASTITESDLDNDSLQAFYMVQEAIDTVATALGLGSNDLWDATSKRINNVADPTLAQDAATKNYVDTVLTTTGNVPVPSASKDILIATGSTSGDFAFATALDTATQIANDLIDSQHIAAGALDNEHYAINSIDGTHIALGSDAQGDVMYYDGTNWVRLAKGTALQQLRTNAGATAPEWATISNAGTLSGALDITNGGADDLTSLALFTGASSVTRFFVYLEDVSTSAANTAPILQLGTGAGPTYATTGYNCRGITGANGGQDDTDGIYPGLETLFDAASVANITVEGTHLGSNVWSLAAHAVRDGATGIDKGIAIVTLGAELTAVQLTTSAGTATFDGGTGYANWYS